MDGFAPSEDSYASLKYARSPVSALMLSLHQLATSDALSPSYPEASAGV